MDVIELLPRLHLPRFPVGQAYLWRDGDDRGELTLIDAGPAGSGAPIAEAVTALGRDPRDVRRVVLTHFHEDHAGGVGECAAFGGAEVLVDRLDAPVVRGETHTNVACFGHADPVTRGAAGALRAMAYA
ncbi:hypothetical protein GCM10010256_70170 [Streptomyces coeruleorubidus]|nr:hypothetical protein GCM10010256_70170 [Streptomyces coeruleorubidus]